MNQPNRIEYVQNVELNIKRFNPKDYKFPIGENLKGPADFAQLAKGLIGKCAQEKFLACMMDAHDNVVAFSELNKGSSQKVDIDIVSLLRTALMVDSRRIVVAHNHPTGPCVPSEQDMKLTIHLIKTLHTLDMELLDHFVVNDEETFSIRDKVGDAAWYNPIMPAPAIEPGALGDLSDLLQKISNKILTEQGNNQ